MAIVERVVLDPSKAGAEVSKWLFGHNLEHTRNCVWRGLAAQVLRNRKFCGEPNSISVAVEWYPIGRGLFRLEPPMDIWGVPGTPMETYTRHWDMSKKWKDFSHQRMRIEFWGDGEAAGIGQDKVPLVGGRKYEFRTAVKVDRELEVRVRICDLKRTKSHMDKRVVLKPQGGWDELKWEFAAVESDEYARLEMTIEKEGILWVGVVALAPAENFLGMREDVVRNLEEIGVPWLRWPGGNFAGDYRWKDGLLPVDQRAGLKAFTSETLRFSNHYDDHEIGIDEYMALCRRLGAEACITINVSLEGPAEAAEWVEYCNGSVDTKWGKVRAERGHAEPYNVKVWSLGNEAGYGHMAGPNGVLEYLKVARECAAAMRKVDPSLKFIASGTWTGQWINEVPAEAYSFFDHISYHRYDKGVETCMGEAGEAEMRRVGRLPVEDWQLIKECRAELSKHLPAGRKVGISYDEWNIWYAWNQVPHVVDGIFAAGFLNMLCRGAQEAGVELGCYFEPVNEGAIVVAGEGSRLTPIGEVFKMYRAHWDGKLIDAGPGVASDVNVCATVKGKKVAVTLVNRQVKEEGVVELVLPGNVKEAKVKVMSGGGRMPWMDFVVKEERVEGGVLRVVLPGMGVGLVEVEV